MSREQKINLSIYKSQCKKAARDLFYGENVLRLIHEAKSEAELCRIVTGARRGEIA